ncbi:MAG TPA: hypothetical protein VN715_16880 [Roseiarcus sp.]|nr:hypothetical protein [Roseiarcus sp.]
MARYAQRCPSPHNTQPFRLRVLNDLAAEVVFLPRRGLPVADPHGRFTWLTAGIFVEVCAIAAHGLGYEIETEWSHSPLYPGGDTETPQTVARVRLHPHTGPLQDIDANLILLRQTSRLPYSGEPCPQTVIDELKIEAERLGHRFETRSDADAIR